MHATSSIHRHAFSSSPTVFFFLGSSLSSIFARTHMATPRRTTPRMRSVLPSIQYSASRASPLWSVHNPVSSSSSVTSVLSSLSTSSPFG